MLLPENKNILSFGECERCSTTIEKKQKKTQHATQQGFTCRLTMAKTKCLPMK